MDGLGKGGLRVKENYQLETDKIVGGLTPGKRYRLLLHSCCGPCSSYVIEYLSRYFDITVLYYNPNVQPEEEFDKRLIYQRSLVENIRVPNPPSLIADEWHGDDFLNAVRGLENEPEGGERCTECFRLRLEETARRAKEGDFDFFCTTLSVSPHKDAERINRIGAEMGEKYGVPWLPSDFKKRNGYKRSIELSREYGLYRQDYCGCLFSRDGHKAYRLD
jgi:predicted adenine nucleotide alpha hydrolase (AANH) superfamily ATPase